jgi:dUTP pyrophosphatase
MPPGTYGQIKERSGLANRHGLQVLAGVIDSDYRDEILVLLKNGDSLPYTVIPNDRIAQIVFQQHLTPTFVECEQLPPADQPHAGFGSTGV